MNTMEDLINLLGNDQEMMELCQKHKVGCRVMVKATDILKAALMHAKNNTFENTTITVTQGELYFIVSCLEGRKALLELLAPGDFGEETPEMVTELITKIKGQV